jgi:hypothetical protein
MMMLDSIDSLSFKELSLYFKETLIQVLSAANFINQPEIFLVLNLVF